MSNNKQRAKDDILDDMEWTDFLDGESKVAKSNKRKRPTREVKVMNLCSDEDETRTPKRKMKKHRPSGLDLERPKTKKLPKLVPRPPEDVEVIDLCGERDPYFIPYRPAIKKYSRLMNIDDEGFELPKFKLKPLLGVKATNGTAGEEALPLPPKPILKSGRLMRSRKMQQLTVDSGMLSFPTSESSQDDTRHVESVTSRGVVLRY